MVRYEQFGLPLLPEFLSVDVGKLSFFLWLQGDCLGLVYIFSVMDECNALVEWLLARENWSIQRRTENLFNKNPIWNTLDLNPVYCCDKPASDHLSYGRATEVTTNRWIQLKLICFRFVNFMQPKIH
jgi:hypothetical protein